MEVDGIFNRYEVKLQVTDLLLGGLPKDPELIKGFLEGRAKKARTPEEKEQLTKKIAKEIKQKENGEIDYVKEEEKSWTTFKSDETGLYIEERQIKALLREAMSTQRLSSIPGFRDQINHGVFTNPDKIHLKRENNGKPEVIKKPDKHVEDIGHGMSARGPRSFIKRSDAVEGPAIKFELLVAKSQHPSKEIPINTKRLKDMFLLGQSIGLGANRSQGYGKFNLLKFEEIKSKKKN